MSLPLHISPTDLDGMYVYRQKIGITDQNIVNFYVEYNKSVKAIFSASNHFLNLSFYMHLYISLNN